MTFEGLEPAHRYGFALVAEDSAGNVSARSNSASGQTRAEGPLASRTGTALVVAGLPARPPIQLWWQIVSDAAEQRSVLRIHDVAGRLVRTFTLGAEPAGLTTWDGNDDGGRALAAGIYIVDLTSGREHARARVVLLP